MDDKEHSKAGNPIFRHKDPPKEYNEVAPSEDIEAISDHVEKYIGPIESVFHEIVSEGVHLDVNWITPTKENPFHIMVTMGMSDRPMKVPKELAAEAYAELLVILPGDWPVTQEAFKDENNYWPVRLLKDLARLPHRYDTWLGIGHTMPNGNPAESYASNTSLCCALILPPPMPEEFFQLHINKQKTIRFYAVIPLYVEEMNFKLDQGLEALIDRFDKFGVGAYIDIHRPNMVTGTKPTVSPAPTKK